MVTKTADRTKLVVESAEAVLGLHWFVARDYTAKEEGLEFEIITPGIHTKFELTDPRPPRSPSRQCDEFSEGL